MDILKNIFYNIGINNWKLVNDIIKEKVRIALKNNLKIIFCIGENMKQKRKKQTMKILKSQISKVVKNKFSFKNIIIAYEPIWSIGTGIIPKNLELTKNINNIKKILNKLKKSIKPKVLYGGSVNPKNVKELAQIKEINGFLVGGSSLSAKKFIDIIQKSIN